ncbi:MAG: hypothetical protein IKL51_06060, partial [Lachnospiraceae bacterium]|nr:hypothetical protein [Lachnospiraceae bacterium]
GVIGETGLVQLKEESSYKLLAQTMIPAITLKAFSIELALKALVVKNGKNYGNLHELNKLYIEISEDDRDKIKRNVVSQMKKDWLHFSVIDINLDLKWSVHI